MVTKRLILGALGASLFAIIVGCGGGGGSDPASVTPPAVDKTAPVVKSLKAVVLGTAYNEDIMVPGKTNVPKNVILIAEVDEVTPECPTAQPIKVFFDTLEGSFTCVKNNTNGFWTWTLVPTKPFADGSVVTVKVSPTDAAGNKGLLETSFTVAPVPLATVTFSATPTTVVAGNSTTLAWAPINAANCLASGGWTGSVSNTGGSQVVNPTTTTTYGIECWNSTNVSTGVVSATVTVTPKPVVTHPAVVVAFGSDWVYRVDGGLDPIVNNTGHPRIGSFGFRATALPNCQIQVSALGTGNATISIVYDRIRKDVVIDTTGTAPPRTVENYIFALPFNPAFPTSFTGLVVGDEKYWAPELTTSLWYQSGATPAVELGSYPGVGFKGFLFFPACTVK